jgi:hypothetical protein
MHWCLLLLEGERQLQLIAGMNFALLGPCKICYTGVKMGLGGPIGLNCESVGCFGQYMCCKCNKIRVCQRMILSYFLSILVTCAQNNTFLIREGTCPWCRKAYKSFTPQGLVDRSKSLGAVAAIILADFSSKNIYVFFMLICPQCVHLF